MILCHVATRQKIKSQKISVCERDTILSIYGVNFKFVGKQHE